MNKSENLNELYTKFGIAAEKAQVLELEAGNVVLSYITLFVNTENITVEEKKGFKKLIEDVDAKTLGNLLTKIKSIVNFDTMSENIINEALNKRNYLTHRFFKTHNFAIYNETGRNAMINELEEISNYFDTAHNHLSTISKLMAKVAGRKDISIEKTKELIEQGKKLKI